MARPLRIAVFVGTFPVASETFILRQISGLIEDGHEVDLYAESRGDARTPLQPEIERHGLLERTTFLDLPPECSPWELPAAPPDGETWLPGASSPIPNRTRWNQAEQLRSRWASPHPELTRQALSEEDYGYRALSFSALHRLDRLASLDRRYDVLHAHFGPVGESFRFARSLWKAPLVVSFHGYDFCTVPRREGPRCYERLFATADAITANSEYTAERLRQLGCRPETLHLLPMGLAPEAFNFRERRPAPGQPVRLLTVARLVEIKGHEFVLRALATLAPNHPELRYEIVGDGPLRGSLEALTRELGLQNVVTFHGALAQPDVQRHLDQAHLFLLTSVTVAGDAEGQGLALLEAQACGLPVIATRHGAFPEGVQDGVTGWLVPERDVPALALQIESALQHPDQWPVLGQAGRSRVTSRYDQRELNKKLSALYTNLIIYGVSN